MATGVFGVGISGLNAAQMGLITTGHNIANANTEGYHRQTIMQAASPPLLTGAGFLGQGVKVETVQRAYSSHLETQVAASDARAHFFGTYATEIAQIDNLLADPQSGLAPAMQDFFSTVNDVAAHPSSIPSRQQMLASGSSLEQRFRLIDGRLSEIRDGVNSQLNALVQDVNVYASGIANLNNRILVAQNNPEQPPNDLMDQRDALVAKLNQLVGASVVRQDDGSYSVFVGTGQSLVVGAQSYRMTMLPGREDPAAPLIGYTVNGNTVTLDTRSLNNGQMGGLLAFRDEALAGARNTLGQVAAGLAVSFNELHAAGQDLNGQMGGAFFNPPQPMLLARASNTGNASISASISDVAGLVASDYRLEFSAGAYRLTRLSDGAVNNFASLPQTVDGMTLTLAAGAMANGDAYLIQPVSNAPSQISLRIHDPALIAAAAPLRTATASANSGSGVISAGAVNTVSPLNANLGQPVSITFTGAGTFDVSGTGTGNPTGLVYTPGADISFNGWTVQISGAPRAGDVFTIAPNGGATADGRNALRLAGLQAADTLGGGTASYQGVYAQIVGDIGNKAHEVEITAQAQENIATQSRAAQQSLSGVNLDEEAANLLRYQQAYQASGKLIQIAASMFQSILDIGGR